MLNNILDFFRHYGTLAERFHKAHKAEIDDKAVRFALEQGVDASQFLDVTRAQFIGPNAKFYISRFDTKGFHFLPAAMLGPFWLAWRRMYRLAISHSFWVGAWWAFISTYFTLRFGMSGVPAAITLFVIGLLIYVVLNGVAGLAHYKGFVALKSLRAIQQSSSFDELSKTLYATGRVSLAALLLVPLFVVVGIIAGTAGAYQLQASVQSRIANDQTAGLPIEPAQPTTACRIISAETEVAFVLTDDLFGYDIVMMVESVGGPGLYTVRAVLNSSDGTFERSQQYALEESKPVKLTFNFPEATWGATNVQGQVYCQ